MKKMILFLLISVILVSVVTTTGAVYNRSFQLKSGNVGAASSNTPAESTNVLVRDSLTMKQSTIQGNVAVANGPVQIKTGNCKITGKLTLNPDVSLNSPGNVVGDVVREPVVFTETSYDFSLVPSNLPNRGDSSSNSDPVISASVRYNNFNVNTPVTINTQNGDVFVVARYLNISANVVVSGAGRAILIAEQTFNFNNAVLNPNQPSNKLDLVVKSSALNLQNNFTIRANFYFEGSSLNILNGFNITGKIFAAKASVSMNQAQIYGYVLCKSLNIESWTDISNEA